jgi:hypothetical protein
MKEILKRYIKGLVLDRIEIDKQRKKVFKIFLKVTKHRHFNPTYTQNHAILNVYRLCLNWFVISLLRERENNKQANKHRKKRIKDLLVNKEKRKPLANCHHICFYFC